MIELRPLTRRLASLTADLSPRGEAKKMRIGAGLRSPFVVKARSQHV
jgi:hypothetical protein